MESAQVLHPESLGASLSSFWRMAPSLKPVLQSFNPTFSGLRSLLLEGMRELLSELQTWTWRESRPPEAEKVIKDLTKDIRRCERAMRGSAAAREESVVDETAVNETRPSVNEETSPEAQQRERTVLKLTIPVALTKRRAESQSCDLTDRLVFRKYMYILRPYLFKMRTL